MDQLWGGKCVDRVHSEPKSVSNEGDMKGTTTFLDGDSFSSLSLSFLSLSLSLSSMIHCTVEFIAESLIEGFETFVARLSFGGVSLEVWRFALLCFPLLSFGFIWFSLFCLLWLFACLLCLLAVVVLCCC